MRGPAAKARSDETDTLALSPQNAQPHQDRGHQIRAGALLSYATIALDAAAGLLYTPWMVSTIGSSSYGLYTLALSLVNIFLLDFGLGSAVSKYLSGYYAKGENDRANRFLGAVYKLYTVIASVVCVMLVAAYFLIDVVYGRLTPNEVETFKVLYIVVATYSVVSFPFLSLNGILLSNERFIALKSCAFLQKLATVSLIVFALILGGDVYALVAVNALVGLIFTAIKFIIIRSTTHARADFGSADRGLTRDILGFTGWVTISQIAQRFIFNVTPVILGAMTGSREIAIFGLASSLEGYVFTVSEALNGLFLPRVSRIVGGEDPAGRLLDLMVRVGRLQIYVLGLIVLGFISVGSKFVLAWMGGEYSLVFYCAVILMLPALWDLPQQIARTAVLATDNVRLQAYVYVVMVMFNIVLTVLLSSALGVVGACLSVCIAYLIRTFGMNVIYRGALRIDIAEFFRRTYGAWLVPAGVALAFGLAFDRVLPMSGWGAVVIEVAAFTAVYGILMYTRAFDSGERRLILDLVSQRGRDRRSTS